MKTEKLKVMTVGWKAEITMYKLQEAEVNYKSDDRIFVKWSEFWVPIKMLEVIGQKKTKDVLVYRIESTDKEVSEDFNLGVPEDWQIIILSGNCRLKFYVKRYDDIMEASSKTINCIFEALSHLVKEGKEFTCYGDKCSEGLE